MRLHTWIRAAVACAMLTLGAAGAHAQAKSGLSFESGFEPAQDLTVWPLDISQGYPWVRGQVGNVQGVFLLDTGTPWGLLLNRARVDLPEVKFVLTAKAGSGQSFDVVRAASMPPLVLHGQSWRQVRNVHAGDLSFVENGTGIGPLLGFIGAHFFGKTALTLDYARRVAVIRRTHSDTGTPMTELPPEMSSRTVLTTVNYRGDNPAFPLFDATLGATPVRVMLDSGNPRATADVEWLAELRRDGLAKPFSRSDADATYRTSPLQIGEMTVPMLDLLGSGESGTLAGRSAPPLVRIGFALLNRFGVTWNYPRQTMEFFAHQ